MHRCVIKSSSEYSRLHVSLTQWLLQKPDHMDLDRRANYEGSKSSKGSCLVEPWVSGEADRERVGVKDLF